MKIITCIKWSSVPRNQSAALKSTEHVYRALVFVVEIKPRVAALVQIQYKRRLQAWKGYVIGIPRE
jgi:hypothetical protein